MPFTFFPLFHRYSRDMQPHPRYQSTVSHPKICRQRIPPTASTHSTGLPSQKSVASHPRRPWSRPFAKSNSQAEYPKVTCGASRTIASMATLPLGDSVRDLTQFPWTTHSRHYLEPRPLLTRGTRHGENVTRYFAMAPIRRLSTCSLSRSPVYKAIMAL